MKIIIEMQIDMDHPDAQKATDKQVKEWVEFNLGNRCKLDPSPIDRFDTAFDYEPTLKRVVKIIR